jgi:Threonyl-tRNA synthetase
MIKIFLKDGKTIEVEKGSKVAEIASKLSISLGKKALGAKLNGKVVELMQAVDEECKLEILTFEDDEGKKILRHTASHILAQAVKRLYPDVKLAIGPSIDNGFYYDLDAEFSFTPELLEKIEAEMKK